MTVSNAWKLIISQPFEGEISSSLQGALTRSQVQPSAVKEGRVMSHTIWKAVLKAADIQDIEVPEHAELLTARNHNEQLCVWFKCDPSNNLTKRQIVVVGTGHPAPEGARYIGTGFLEGGRLVFHVFENK